jgi:MFS family permease
MAPEIMRDLGVGADGLGLLTSVYFLAFAVMQLPVGVLLDRYGPRRVQFALLMCAAIGSALCAFGTGFLALLVGRALIGFGTAGGLVAGLKASAEWFPREVLSRVNGLFIMCGGLGALGATWPAEFAIRLIDWRGLSALLAALVAAAAIAVRFGVPDRPRRAETQGPTISLQDVARDKQFQRFAPLSAACFGTVLAVQGLWAGPWLADVDLLSRSDVATDLAVMAAVLIVAAPCWGLLVERLRQWMKLANATAVAAGVMIATELFVVVHGGVPAAVPWCLFAVFGGITVLSYSVMAEAFPPAAIGRANGALNVLHIGFSFLIQFGFGQIVAHWTRIDGHYPKVAYEAGLLLPVMIQITALAWFAWPRGGWFPPNEACAAERNRKPA